MKCMQEKFKTTIAFLFFLGFIYCKAEIPNIAEAKKILNSYSLFGINDLDAMCTMHQNEEGFFEWTCAFQTIYNSDLSYDEQLKPLTYLLVLGINQVTNKDINLINIIKEKLKSDYPFNFEELRDEFESRSRSSSPKGSDDE